MENKFEILDEVNRQYRRSNAEGTQLKVRLFALPYPSLDDYETVTDPVTHYATSMNALFDYALRNVADTDMVGMVIHQECKDRKINLQDSVFGARTKFPIRLFGISLRRWHN
jgi:hypothetical protein